MAAPILEDLRDDLRELSEVKSAWIDEEEEVIHVVVTGRTYSSVANCLDTYKREHGVSQIEHPDAEYRGAKRHYVLSAD